MREKYSHYDGYVKESGIPLRYQTRTPLQPCQADLAKFQRLSDIENNIKEWLEDEPHDLIIQGNYTGTGKTSWATRLGLATMSYIDDKYEFIRPHPPVRFIDVTDFLNRMKWGMKNQKIQESVDSDIDCVYNSDLIIWDDLGVGEYSGYDLSVLEPLIAYRTNNSMKNIYTTNCNADTLEYFLQAKLYDRVWHYSEIIRFEENGTNRK